MPALPMLRFDNVLGSLAAVPGDQSHGILIRLGDIVALEE